MLLGYQASNRSAGDGSEKREGNPQRDPQRARGQRDSSTTFRHAQAGRSPSCSFQSRYPGRYPVGRVFGFITSARGVRLSYSPRTSRRCLPPILYRSVHCLRPLGRMLSTRPRCEPSWMPLRFWQGASALTSASVRGSVGSPRA